MFEIKEKIQPIIKETDSCLFLHFIFIYYSVFASIFYYPLPLYKILDSFIFSSLIIFLLLFSYCSSIYFIKSITSTNSKLFKYAHIVLKTALLTVLSVSIIVSIIDFFVFLYFKQRLTTNLIFVLFETNFRESQEFISMYSDLKLFILLLYILLPFLGKFIIGKISIKFGLIQKILKRVYVVVILLSLVVGVTNISSVWHSHNNPLTLFITSIRLYKTELQAYQRIKNNISAHTIQGKVRSNISLKYNLFVLVIGESTNRNHMGLYGYYRKTTPNLAKLSSNLYIFKDVIAPHSHTVPVFKKMLTFKNNESSKEWYEYPRLIGCFNDAGYKTYWISNQELYGVLGNLVSALASQAKVRIFNEYRKSKEKGKKYDGELLKYLNNILSNDNYNNKFIIIHLMGNHSAYSERYPQDFQKFDYTTVDDGKRYFLNKHKKKIISYYDNAVLYNDYVISEIIKRVKKENMNSYVLYVSDHGEEVYDNRYFCGHTEKVGNRHMIEVPFILWLSDKYIANNQDKVAIIEKSSNNPYMLDDLIHTLFDLSSLSYDLYVPERSVINAKYEKTRKRIYAGKDYDKVLKYDKSKYLILDNFEKIWAHRVNSIGKLQQASKIFSGVELDIVFKQENHTIYFDVNHPPAESIHLTLDEYLYSARSCNKLKYWLDLKNLSPNNKHLVLKHLKKLIKKYNLNNRIILESPEYQSLTFLSQNNIYTSYYLPSLKVDEMTVDEKIKKAKELIANATYSEIKAISFPGHMYQYVKDYIFPRIKNVEMLTWFPAKRIDYWFDVSFLQKIANDQDIAVVLVGYATKFDR